VPKPGAPAACFPTRWGGASAPRTVVGSTGLLADGAVRRWH